MPVCNLCHVASILSNQLFSCVNPLQGSEHRGIEPTLLCVKHRANLHTPCSSTTMFEWYVYPLWICWTPDLNGISIGLCAKARIISPIQRMKHCRYYTRLVLFPTSLCFPMPIPPVHGQRPAPDLNRDNFSLGIVNGANVQPRS
jgi:hypothetical protein